MSDTNPEEGTTEVLESQVDPIQPKQEKTAETGSPTPGQQEDVSNAVAENQASEENREVNSAEADAQVEGEDGLPGSGEEKKKRKKLKKHKEKKSKKDKKHKKKKKKKSREEREQRDIGDDQEYEEHGGEDDDEEVGVDPDEAYSPHSSSKKGRRRGKKRAKVTRDNIGEGEGGDILSDDEPAPRSGGLVDQLIKTGRNKRYKADEHQIDEEVQNMIIEMKRAYEQDQRSTQAGKPAIHKLKMLDQVVSFLKRTSVLNTWTEDGGLNIVSKWLQKLPDGSYPNMSIRTRLLECLPDMPVEVSQLKESGIGRVIFEMVQDPLETPENKKTAGVLVTKWSRIIFGKDNNYSSLDPTEDIQEVPVNLGKQHNLSRGNTVSSNGGDDFDTQENIQMASARIVERNVKSYKIRPVSNLADRRSVETFENDSSVNRIKKRMQGILRSNTQSKSRMSIEGKD